MAGKDTGMQYLPRHVESEIWLVASEIWLAASEIWLVASEMRLVVAG